VFTEYSHNHLNANFAIGVKLLGPNHVESRCHGRRCIRLGANKSAAPVVCSLRYPELRDAGSAEGRKQHADSSRRESSLGIGFEQVEFVGGECPVHSASRSGLSSLDR
jgi:hypothetical protein